MPVKADGITYYFDAVIIRAGRRIKRQGTVSAMSPAHGLDMVLALARGWKKPLVQVDLYEIVEGDLDLVLQSKVGMLPDNSHTESRPKDKTKEVVGANDDKGNPADGYGYPHNNGYSPSYSYSVEFWPSSIGSYFAAETTFAILKLPEDR